MIEVKETLAPISYPEDSYDILGTIAEDGRGILISSPIEDERWSVKSVEKELNRIENGNVKIWGDLHLFIEDQLILVLILPTIYEAQEIFKKWKRQRGKFEKEVMQCK